MPRRTALVPGGARGIGRAIGLDLARQGWAVAFCYRERADTAAATRQALEATGVPVLALRADVADPDAAADLVRRVEGAWGRVDALIHCAGPFHRSPLLEETPAAWQATFAANLHSLFYLSRAVAPGMIARRWGRILGFGLATADRVSSHPTLTAYALAKTGVLGLVRSLARVLAPHGVTVNAISPGVIDSGGTSPEELEALQPAIPAGHVGRVDDAVAAARFLLSEEAGYVTGSNLVVSGGWGI